MIEGRAMQALQALVEEARRRRPATGPRVVVQVGHCSAAVGAEGVAEALRSALPNGVALESSGCDGACWNAPQVLVFDGDALRSRYGRVTADDVPAIVDDLRRGVARGEAEEVRRFFEGQRRLVLEGCGEAAAVDLDAYLLRGGYSALARALDSSPSEVIEAVRRSGLRGRGGAYFPAAAKWEGARKAGGSPRYLVVNAEEGEPGVFKDRHIMEGTPHRLLEGALIAAYASGVQRAYIYINAEADLSAHRVQGALDQTRQRGLVGDDILGTGWSLEVEIRRGAGGYVCGEETTLLNTMEGRRREPRLRPPYPTEAGLQGRPTVINNVETLAAVPFILIHGPEAFAAIGLEEGSGTKVVSLSGAVQRPGLVEVPMGATLRDVVYGLGGGPPDGRDITVLAVGGPSSGVLPPEMLDMALRPGWLHPSGVMLGAGGVVVHDGDTGPLEVVRGLAAYNASESCGKCTPCREGTPRILDVVERILEGRGRPEDVEELEYLADVVNTASLCGLGQAAGNPIRSALHFFGQQIRARLRAG